MPGVNRQGQAHIVSTAIPLPRSCKAGREVEATAWFRTWFSIDPQPASISPTINISIVFICAFPLIVARSFAIRQSKTILARSERAVGLIDWLGLFVSLLKRPLPSSETLRSGSRCRRRGNCRSWGWCRNGSGCRRGTERRRWTGMRSGTRPWRRPWRRSGRWGWSRSVQFRARTSTKAAIFSRCNKDHAVGQQGGRVMPACCV